MEVVSYKKDRGNRYIVTMDDGVEYKLYDDVILKYELLIEKKIDKKKLEKILEENTLLEAYYRALKYISLRMRSELEIEKYLEKYEYDARTVAYAVKRLRDDGYLDEDKYVKAFINDQVNLTLNGPFKIRNQLRKLGCDNATIWKYLKAISEEEWLGRIKRVLDKKAKTNKAGLAVFKNKMYQELSTLGYGSDDIKAVLEGYSIDTADAFSKEADKTYNKLSSKYSGVELALRFKNKMYMKGFSGEMVDNFLQKKDL